jgi:hypothetical protein
VLNLDSLSFGIEKKNTFQEHEFVRNHLGVIFAVAANNPNPLEAFRNLTQIQQKQQQENRASSYPQYLNANILKYYVLVRKKPFRLLQIK